MKQKEQKPSRRWGFTLIEMLVVVVIISILATIATGVYTGATRRARIAHTVDLIHQLETAIARYESDLGVFPPSGSGDVLLPPDSLSSRLNGSGYLQVALMHSLSGNAQIPASPLWQGPYITIKQEQLAPDTLDAVSLPARYNILDAWGNPMFYVQSEDYSTVTTNFWGGTRIFSSTRPTTFDSNPNLPAPNPYFTQGETYYNPSTYQIVSFGPDGVTPGMEAGTEAQTNYTGTGLDDVTNFGF